MCKYSGSQLASILDIWVKIRVCDLYVNATYMQRQTVVCMGSFYLKSSYMQRYMIILEMVPVYWWSLTTLESLEHNYKLRAEIDKEEAESHDAVKKLLRKYERFRVSVEEDLNIVYMLLTLFI